MFYLYVVLSLGFSNRSEYLFSFFIYNLVVKLFQIFPSYLFPKIGVSGGFKIFAVYTVNFQLLLSNFVKKKCKGKNTFSVWFQY